MLHRGITLVLLFALLLQSFSRMGVLTYFYLNQKTITKTFCINKSKPNLHCNGKCYLAKKLKKAEEKSRQHTSHGVKTHHLTLFVSPLFAYSVQLFSNLQYRDSLVFYLLKSCPKFTFTIFQPPQYQLNRFSSYRFSDQLFSERISRPHII